jgi:hypothetical protein
VTAGPVELIVTDGDPVSAKRLEPGVAHPDAIAAELPRTVDADFELVVAEVQTSDLVVDAFDDGSATRAPFRSIASATPSTTS